MVVINFLQTSCSTAPVKFKAFFDSISVNTGEEGSLHSWQGGLKLSVVE